MFNERKIAQIAAYLLHKGGGRMAHLKLMKLLYLVDREAMARYGAPLSGDRFVSMPQGPVLSMTLNLMDGDVESSPGGWEEWISDKENHEVSLRQKVDRGHFDELSEADIEVLEHVWKKFGRWGKWALRDYTHKQCPEWEDPQGSSMPIPYHRVFRALGKSADEADSLASQLEEERALDKVFRSL